MSLDYVEDGLDKESNSSQFTRFYSFLDPQSGKHVTIVSLKNGQMEYRYRAGSNADKAMSAYEGEKKTTAQRIAELLSTIPNSTGAADAEKQIGGWLLQNGINVKVEHVRDGQDKGLFPEEFTRYYSFISPQSGTRLIMVSHKDGRMEYRYRQPRMNPHEIREPGDAGIPAIIERVNEDVAKINTQLGAHVIDGGWIFGSWADGDWEPDLNDVDVLFRVKSPENLNENVYRLMEAMMHQMLFTKETGYIKNFDYYLYYSPRPDATFLGDSRTRYFKINFDVAKIGLMFSINETARKNLERADRLDNYKKRNYDRLPSAVYGAMKGFIKVLRDTRHMNQPDAKLRALLDGVAARNFLRRADAKGFSTEKRNEWDRGSLKKYFNEALPGEYSLFPVTPAVGTSVKAATPQTAPTGSADRAMKGGIDFNSGLINLQLQNAGKDIRFHIDPVLLHQLQNAPGFVPVITNIQPVNDLKAFLGI